MTDWLLALSYFFHLIATVTWIGGLVLMSVILWPEARAWLARRAQDAQASGQPGGVLFDFFDQFRKRFTIYSNLSLFVLIVTGLFQMDKSPNYDGLLQFTNDWSRAILIKHIATLVMIGIGVLMQFSLIPALERAALLASRGKDAGDLERLRRRERSLTLINTVFGVLVLACTAVATAA